MIISEAFMKRREFIAFLGSVAIAAPREAIAQTPSKVYRLALLNTGGPVADSNPNAKVLLSMMTSKLRC
jgi:putative tryptophan/tyrosine transport system substrate-binding protein